MTTNDTSSHAATERGVSRRTLARGAAWTVPLVAASVAAPAFAASGDCLKFQLSYIKFDAKPSQQADFPKYFSLGVLIENSCASETFTVTRMRLMSTYHAPAANTGAVQVYAYPVGNYGVTAPGKTSTLSFSMVSFNYPRGGINGTTNLMPGYYCSYVSPAPHLPDGPCNRLYDDQTYLVLDYTGSGGTNGTVNLDMLDWQTWPEWPGAPGLKGCVSANCAA